jgi:hypothetical protein
MDLFVPHTLLQVTEKANLYNTTERPEYFFSDQLSAHYDPNNHAMWSRWTPSPRPSFNLDLLKDLANYCRFVSDTDATVDCLGKEMRIEYTVLASGTPGVFNLAAISISLPCDQTTIEPACCGTESMHRRAASQLQRPACREFYHLLVKECPGRLRGSSSSDIIIAEHSAG